MTDYTKMKNADLEGLLKDRGLAHTGKKADLVKRLQDDDATKTDGPAPASTTTKPDAQEDEIDWDDEPAAAATDASKATTEPAAAAIAAGGQGQVSNPLAVPNQVPAIDPAETHDLTVSEPAAATGENAPAPESQSVPEETAAEAPVAAEKEKTPVDFSAGIAKTTLEQEIEKRKARAKKFGLDESTDETLKELERAKRFGATDLPGRLNEALPEKREKKRGREVPEDQSARKRTRPGPGGRKDSERRNPGKPSAPKAQAGQPARGKPAPQISDADKAKAEARKARFASAA